MLRMRTFDRARAAVEMCVLVISKPSSVAAGWLGGTYSTVIQLELPKKGMGVAWFP